ncbi:MAG: hypothetical protein ABGX16_04505 [Pirellulales bacterium]
MTNRSSQTETEEVEPIPDVCDVGLFQRQGQTAFAIQKVADFIAEYSGTPLRTSCEKDAPVVRIPDKPKIRSPVITGSDRR